jgi:hypothetical protein
MPIFKISIMKKNIKSSLVGLLLIGGLAIGVIYFFPEVL